MALLLRALCLALVMAASRAARSLDVLAAEVGQDDVALKSLMARVVNASSMAAVSQQASGKKGNLDVACINFCLVCEDGTPWEIHRSQSLATKLAKAVGATLIIAAIATGFGPIVALFGVAGVTAAGILGGAHLALELHKEAPFCPNVKFTKEVPEEKKKGSLTLNELNLEEIMMLDTGNFPPGSSKWAVACNYMMMSISKWEKHGERQAEKVGEAMPQLQKDVITACGRWLCNGQEVQSNPDFKCGGPWWKQAIRFVR